MIVTGIATANEIANVTGTVIASTTETANAIETVSATGIATVTVSATRTVATQTVSAILDDVAATNSEYEHLGDAYFHFNYPVFLWKLLHLKSFEILVFLVQY